MKQSKWTYNVDWDELTKRADTYNLFVLSYRDLDKNWYNATVLIDHQGYMSIVSSEVVNQPIPKEENDS
jgi:hypothetical protein